MEEVILQKDGRLLSLNDGNRSSKFDFKEKKFISYTGKEIKISTLKSQLSNKILNKEASNEIYVKLFDFIRMNGLNGKRRHINLGSIVSLLPHYTEEEKYISQGFRITRALRGYEIENLKKIPKNIKNICLRREIAIEKCACFNEKGIQLFIEEMDKISESNGEFYKYVDYLFKTTYNWRLNRYEYESEKINIINELFSLHNYKMKSLCQYMVNVYEYEAMDVSDIASYLLDYLKMSTLMGATKINKYPKYLHTTHDIVVRNFNSFGQERDDDVWQKLVKPNLEYKKGKYCIVYPKSYREVQAEGANLHHCVASYVDKVFSLKCDIVFLRLAEKPNESLVTVEVRNNTIVQHRGSYNRRLTDEELKFLQIYAKEKNINY